MHCTFLHGLLASAMHSNDMHMTITFIADEMDVHAQMSKQSRYVCKQGERTIRALVDCLFAQCRVDQYIDARLGEWKSMIGSMDETNELESKLNETDELNELKSKLKSETSELKNESNELESELKSELKNESNELGKIGSSIAKRCPAQSMRHVRDVWERVRDDQHWNAVFAQIVFGDEDVCFDVGYVYDLLCLVDAVHAMMACVLDCHGMAEDGHVMPYYGELSHLVAVIRCVSMDGENVSVWLRESVVRCLRNVVWMAYPMFSRMVGVRKDVVDELIGLVVGGNGTDRQFVMCVGRVCSVSYGYR